MERLYTLVGQIIENAQYIEWNLALMLRCHMILKEFEENDTIPLSVFENVVKDAEDLSYELSHQTLGEIVHRVKETRLLKLDDILKLEKVLRERNKLVHHYFKKHDFDDNSNVEKEISYLTNILNNMNQVNITLADIINQQQEQINSIE